MKAKMNVTLDALVLAQGVFHDVEDAKETARHARAVRKYREEREVVEVSWWIDLGGEGDA